MKSDYYPFGMIMPGRHVVNDDYRYGFQGQEKDDEVKGTGNSVNYKYRMHDTRLGRFFVVDPVASKYPHYSPYAFSGNRLIDAIELEGLQPGVLFSTMEAAAENWAVYYGEEAISNEKEYASAILEVETEDGVCYKYTEAVSGESGYVKPPEELGLPSAVAGIHNHPVVPPEKWIVRDMQKDNKEGFFVDYHQEEGRSDFSGNPGTGKHDIGIAETYGVKVYLLTPEGELKVYDPDDPNATNEGEIVPTSLDLPTDPDNYTNSYILWEESMDEEYLKQAANNNKVSVSDILKYNNYNSINDIKIGDLLKVPGSLPKADQKKSNNSGGTPNSGSSKNPGDGPTTIDIGN